MNDRRTEPHRVVLADDVAELRALVALALERSGRFRVVAHAANGEEAVSAAGEHRPDLVLLDVSMPVMDGLEALPKVLSAAPETIVVMLSGFAEQRLGHLAAEGGARAYLEKGIPPGQLVDRLLEILGDRPLA